EATAKPRHRDRNAKVRRAGWQSRRGRIGPKPARLCNSSSSPFSDLILVLPASLELGHLNLELPSGHGGIGIPPYGDLPYSWLSGSSGYRSFNCLKISADRLA